MEFSPKTIAEIEKLYKGRHHVELSIGVLKDGEITYSHRNPSREEDDALLVYPVGCAIGTHVGPGAIALAYFCKGRD